DGADGPVRHQEAGRRWRAHGARLDVAEQDLEAEGPANGSQERAPGQAIGAPHYIPPGARTAAVAEAAISRMRSVKVWGVVLNLSMTALTAQLSGGISCEMVASE